VQLGIGEERSGGFDRVELVDDQDIVGIARRPVNGLSGNAACGLQGGDGVVYRSPGVEVADAVQDQGNGHGCAPYRLPDVCC
jgi:hypothetical protein